jgi:hypothetical protein
MEVTLKTKFSIGDKCFGWYNGHLWCFIVSKLIIKHEEGYYTDTRVTYECSPIPPKGENWEVTLNETFEEHQLYTKEEIRLWKYLTK